jgi:predicted metal-dependent hydrolase
MKSSHLIIGMLSVLLLCFAKTTYKRVYQISNINKKRYLVRQTNSRTQLKSANLLASLNEKKNELCKFVEKSPKYKSHYGIKRLLQNKNVKLEELSYEYNNEAAYSVNKGEKIGICLRNKKGEIENENTMTFVLLHELAHIMSKTYAHDKEFWNNFSLLLQAASSCGIYKYTNYEANPTTYCGHNITHTPN